MFKVRDRLKRREKSSKEERSYVQNAGQAGKEGQIVKGREKLCSKCGTGWKGGTNRQRKKELSYVQSKGQAEKEGQIVQGREKLCSK